MGIEQSSVFEIVDKAVTHKWGVPEFQRGFVWTPQKVRDLIDSLWRGYPIGSFLIWYGGEYEQTKTAQDSRGPDAWIVDGQQRTTALSVLFGRKPYWWEEEWDETLNHHDVRFNVLAEEEPHFSRRTAAMRGQAGRAWISVREIVAADDQVLSDLVSKLLQELELPQSQFGTLWMKLDSVRKIRNIQVPVISVMMDLEDVTEIFARLNSEGTKVTEADIALALAASQNPGWARTEFLPFLKELEEAGFDLDPNVIFRSSVGIGLGKARLKDVSRDYWRTQESQDSWKKTATGWRHMVQYVESRGILSTEVLPAKNALIPLCILADRYPDALGSDRPLAWLLHAVRAGRYSGSALTALESDLQAINAAASAKDALQALHKKLEPWEPFTPDDFLQEYRDRFMRLMLYLVMWDRQARDWVSRQRLGFHGTDLLERFNPDWHHIFPRAYLRKSGVPEERWNVFANIAVMSPSTNIRFGAKNPMGYLERYKVQNSLLKEQLVPTNRKMLSVENYERFIKKRAKDLALAANEYYGRLSGQTA